MSKREHTIIHDLLGNEILQGDMIAYPLRQGSSMWMQFAIVEDTVLYKGKPYIEYTIYSKGHYDQKLEKLVNKLKRITIIGEGRIKINKIDASYNFNASVFGFRTNPKELIDAYNKINHNWEPRMLF